MTDVLAACRRAADEAGIPVELLIACCVSESNLDPTARRPRTKEQDASYWPDCSFGIAQQTVRWADEYAAWCRERGHPPAQYPGEEAIRAVGERYYDVEHAARVAARNLAQKWALYKPDLAKTLQAYNWPAGGGRPVDAAVEQNYRRGLEEARRLLGSTTPPPASSVDDILQRVVELGKKEVGKPYTGPIVGMPDSTRWGDPGFDCSSFVSSLFDRATNGAIKLPGFTDAAYDRSEWVKNPRSGTPVYYHYPDSSQAGVTWPHVGIWLSTTEVLDCRYPDGVGIRPHVTPVDDGRGRYRRTMLPKGLASVAGTAPPPADPRDAVIAELQRQLADKDRRLRSAVSLLGSVSGDYANGLQFIVDELRALKPPAN